MAAIMVGFDLGVTTNIETNESPPIDQSSLEDLVAHVLHSECGVGHWEIAIVLTTDDRLRELHRSFMGLDSVTDIVTFAYGDDQLFPEQENHLPVQGGDIVISVQRAAAQASDDGWDTAAEIRFLVCHGVLHLLGWEDRDASQRGKMLDRQRALLRSYEKVSTAATANVPD